MVGYEAFTVESAIVPYEGPSAGGCFGSIVAWVYHCARGYSIGEGSCAAVPLANLFGEYRSTLMVEERVQTTDFDFQPGHTAEGRRDSTPVTR